MIPNPYIKNFLIFEGIDGSGKSYNYEMIKRCLTENYPDVQVAYTKEPGLDRPTGKRVYDILNGEDPDYDITKMAPFHTQTFYIEDRMCNYRNNIIPALQNGKHAFQDRGAPASLCYGSENPNDFYDFMGIHDRIFSAGQVPFIWPDLIVIFDVSAPVAIERIRLSGRKTDAFEQSDILNRVRLNYLAFAKTYPNCQLINGEQSESKVLEQAFALVAPLLGIK